jgi:hypothetical protein
MIALGWTIPGADPPAPLQTFGAPGCTVVAASDLDAADARERLRLQVLCARALPAFLPLAAQHRAGVEEALAHARGHGPDVAARLSALTGRAQITVRAAWEAASDRPDTGDPRGWLRARAARHAREEARAEAVAAELRALLEPRWPMALATRNAAVQADALVEARAAGAVLAHLAKRLVASPALAGARVSLTGPWPAFSFCRAA